jgi:hypothetical protein
MQNQAIPEDFDRDSRSLAPDSSQSQEPSSHEQAISGKENRTWKLKVQGVIIEFDKPIISVREALLAAGFDPTKPWHIFLISDGNRKEELTTDAQIDLRAEGIEKLRLMQRNVDNGDGTTIQQRRAFPLLPIDHLHLDRLELRWETVLVDQRRWLLIHDYVLPVELTPQSCTLALDIPATYPASQIDMFYFAPWVGRSDGREIPSVQIRATIDGMEYQGWSRHRNAISPWDANTDSVRTHLVLVESCLAKEVSQ